VFLTTFGISILLPKKISSQIIYVSLFSLLVLTIILLFILNGPIWLIISLIAWIIVSSLIWLYFGKKIIYQKKTLIKKIRDMWFVIIIISYLLTILFFPLVMIPFIPVRAEFNQGELKKIVNDLTKDCVTDEQKTTSLLNWFDRYSGNIYNVWGAFPLDPFYFGGGKIFNFIICIRTGDENPLFVLTSRCGACGEHSGLFTEMAKEAGLEVRKVICREIDHGWAEVNINNTWIVVDPANVVHRDNKSGYDLSPKSYEKAHAGRTKNISYIYAKYPDGRTEDITNRYTNLTHINITTVDEFNKPVPNIGISVDSYNKFVNGKSTEKKFSTDSNGNYLLEIGGGDIKLIAKSNDFIPLYNESRRTYSDNEYQNVVIVLKNDWTKNDYLIAAIGIIIVIVVIPILYYYRKNRK
jgi:hypothetical protein